MDTMETIPAILLVISCWVMRVYGVQQFAVQPQDTAVIKGQTATMRCSVENRIGQIQWAKGIYLLGYDRSIPGWSRYSITSSNSQEFNLQIINVNLDDDDDYQCQVGPAANNPPLVAQGHLQVLVPPNMPEIIDHPNASIVEVAYTQPVLQLTCIATNARPAAILKWLRNGVELTDGTIFTVEPIVNDKRENSRSVLTIRPKYPDDNGAEYTCEAKNDALISGPLRVMVTLSVQYPPGKPVIDGYQRDQAIRVNDTLKLLCTSTGGNPLAQVVWFRNNEQVDYSYSQHNNKAENDLVLTAQASDNDVEYRCEAWNRVIASTPKIATRTLVVHFPPKNVQITGIKEAKVGETLTLTCTTSNSNPAAEVTWIPPRATQPVQSTSRTERSPDGGWITISEIQVTLIQTQSSVMYTCQAVNHDLGTVVSDTAIVGVLYPPNPPEIFDYQEGDSIGAGTLLSMKCRATGGNPRATLAWYKGDELLDSDNSTSVGNMASAEFVKIAAADDNGALYKCTAWNKAIDVPLEAVRKVTVHFPPAGVHITIHPKEVRAGQLLRLTCVAASSNPAAKITWVHGDRTLPGSDRGAIAAEYGGMSATNVLEISPTPADHGAVFGCRAENLKLAEVIHDAITLNVLFKPVYYESVVPRNQVMEEGQSRVINLTASANPTNCSYSLQRDHTPLSLPWDISSFSLLGGDLTISGINRNDGGNFTVVALNSQGLTSYDFTLNVIYPAEVLEANTVEGEAGSNVELKCVVAANPMIPEMVSWKRDGFDMTRTLQTYSGGVGTLLIEGLLKQDSGMFTCIADNHVGTPVTRDVELKVTFSPVIDKSQEFTKAASDTDKGRSTKLICLAQGAPTVAFSWAKDGVPIVADDVKYEITQKVENGIDYENILLVKNVVKTDYGIYNCIVTNEKGEDTLSIRFDDITKPDSPYEITFVNATHNSITLMWKNGFSGGREQSYRVRYREQGSAMGYTQVDVVPFNAKIFTVRSLEMGSRYELTVMAYNSLGDSPYQPIGLTAKTSVLKPGQEGEEAATDSSEDAPVIIILVVCVVGIFLLALNIGLILFFVRRRRKRMENGSDTTSHTNTIELYGPSKETALYPMTPSDENRSYGTYDKNHDDDFSDEYKSYDEDDIKRVFLPPPEYGDVTYSHNKLDSPTFEHRHPVHTQTKQIYSDTDTERKSPWRHEDPYTSRSSSAAYRDKRFEVDYADELREASASGSIPEPNGRLPSGHHRPKSQAEYSDRSSRPSSRGGQTKTPPPPPTRSSSKGVADIPPLPARNYGSQEAMPRYVPPPGGSNSSQEPMPRYVPPPGGSSSSQEPMPRYVPPPGGSSSSQEPMPRYVPPPGSLSSFPNNVNVIPNPAYEGPSIRTPSPRQQNNLADDMRGHLV